MKQWMIVLGVAFALLTLAGCERKKVDEDQAYDPKMDPRSSTVRTTPDPGVAEDQKAVSRKMGGAGEKATPATPAAPAAPEAKTPKQAFEKLLKAVADGDKATVAALLDAPGNLPDVIGSAATLVPCVTKFQEARTKEYGKDAFKTPDAEGAPPSMGPSPGDMVEGLAKLKDTKWLADVTFKEDGDKATATLKDQPQPIPLVKKDGVWKISLGDALPVKDMAKLKPLIDAAATALPKIKGVIDGSTKKVGKPDYTAAKILEELKAEAEPIIMPLFGQAMQLMMSGMGDVKMETAPAEAPVPAAP